VVRRLVTFVMGLIDGLAFADALAVHHQDPGAARASAVPATREPARLAQDPGEVPAALRL
jgi:hypothetical protein